MCTLLVEFIVTLRSLADDASGAPATVVDPALSLLLFHMLVRCQLYADLTSLVHAQVFSDSVELATAALTQSDLLREANMPALTRTSLTILQARGAAATLQQFGVDMLWRLRKTSVLAHWLAHHKQVVDAARMSTYLLLVGDNNNNGDGDGDGRIIEKLSDIFPSDLLVSEARAILGLDMRNTGGIHTSSPSQNDNESLFSLYLHLKS